MQLLCCKPVEFISYYMHFLKCIISRELACFNFFRIDVVKLKRVGNTQKKKFLKDICQQESL